MRKHSRGGRIYVWFPALTLLLAAGLALFLPSLRAQAGVQGQWRTLASLMPINPVHLALMNNGKVLIVAGRAMSRRRRTSRRPSGTRRPNTFVTQPLAWDMFCNGMVVLPDGRVFINGGNLQYDPFHGEPRNAVFDPATGTVHRRRRTWRTGAGIRR